MIMPKNWRVLLDGFPHESGDVITRDGEIIGTWYLIDDVFYAFTPDGADEHLFFEPFLGILCHKIADWHEQREAAAAFHVDPANDASVPSSGPHG
ncbi:hypothetical protein [Agrobacterium cavarae]